MEPVKPQHSASDKQVALERVRPELNLEKWPLWQPSNSRNAPKAKLFTRDIQLADGTTSVAKVKVGYTDEGMLTTEDQKILYALYKQWELRGKDTQQTFFSLQGLARMLKRKWGTNVIEALTRSLLRLRVTPFTWENAYFDKSSGETVEILDTFNILSDLKIIKRKKDGHVTKEAGYFKFNDFILNNLLANHTKPIILDVVVTFKSDIAQLLYLRLDLMLSDKTHYERCSMELFKDLALEGKAYKNLSNRKQVLERALKELRGKPISSGTISSAELEPTKDGSDYKLVVRKSRTAAAMTESLEEGREVAPAIAVEPPPKDELTSQAAELVKLFFKQFHNSDKAHIDSKALGQSISLISQHGFEPAKFIVEFAHRVAPETDYHPQTFGGILQYTARGLAAYEQEQLNQAQVALQEEEHQRLETERTQEQIRLTQLPEDQRKALSEMATENIRQKFSFMTESNWDSAMFQAVVRQEMIRLLDKPEEQGTESTEPILAGE